MIVTGAGRNIGEAALGSESFAAVALRTAVLGAEHRLTADALHLLGLGQPVKADPVFTIGGTFTDMAAFDRRSGTDDQLVLPLRSRG